MNHWLIMFLHVTGQGACLHANQPLRLMTSDHSRAWHQHCVHHAAPCTVAACQHWMWFPLLACWERQHFWFQQKKWSKCALSPPHEATTWPTIFLLAQTDSQMGTSCETFSFWLGRWLNVSRPSERKFKAEWVFSQFKFSLWIWTACAMQIQGKLLFFHFGGGWFFDQNSQFGIPWGHLLVWHGLAHRIYAVFSAVISAAVHG